MNGIHDMGGTDGFGKVEPEANEPTFHGAGCGWGRVGGGQGLAPGRGAESR
jgi:nitrile hydratase beta subunit-like protein